MGSLGLLITFILVSLFAQCQGQATICRKFLTGKFGDIFVASKSCELLSVNANTVTVRARSNLTVDGRSFIKRINTRNRNFIALKNRTFVGIVAASNKASISIAVEKTSFVRTLILSKAGNTTAQGPFGFIKSVNSGVLNVSSSSVRNDIVVQGGVGDVNVRGSVITNRTLITSREGSVSLSSSSLGFTLLRNIFGDASITTSTANKASILENIRGTVTLSGLSFFGRVTVTEERIRKVGRTTIKESSFRRRAGKLRLSVQRRGRLSVTSTNFFNGTAVFRRNAGPVLFQANGDVNVTFIRDNRLQIFENNIGNADMISCTGGIVIERNGIRNATLDSCSGKITIRQNVFGALGCTKNKPAPVGEQNTISTSATGQCAKFQG